MAEAKTRANDGDVGSFLAGIGDDERRRDCELVAEMMAAATGHPATMWGGSIVGYGAAHYRYASGREGDWFETGFASRKNSLTLYITPGFGSYQDLLERLGTHSTGVSCLYIKRLADVDLDVLQRLIERSVAHIREHGLSPADVH